MTARRFLASAIGLTTLVAAAATSAPAASSTTGMRVVHDVAYGALAAERFDVYAPPHAKNAPVVLMVHGGAWAVGDKSAARVVRNKVARWVPRGFVLISTNYPLLPGTPPLEQARHVAKALAYAQRHAARWGGSRGRFVLMGHSAGAHLVSLISAEPELARSRGATPWLGTIALDSAAYDVAAIMQRPHPPLYDAAFGSDPATWAAVSPSAQLHAPIAPFLAVCSSLRTDACPQAQAFVAKARSLGTRAKALREPLAHSQINSELGLASTYTMRVEAFMGTLSPAVARLLARP